MFVHMLDGCACIVCLCMFVHVSDGWIGWPVLMTVVTEGHGCFCVFVRMSDGGMGRPVLMTVVTEGRGYLCVRARVRRVEGKACIDDSGDSFVISQTSPS